MGTRAAWGRALTLVAVAALLGGLCLAAPVSARAEEVDARLVLPPVPDPPGDAIRVDPDLLDALACEHCLANDPPDAIRFMFADLARSSVDAVCDSGNGQDARLPALLGGMYVSGYLGGVWFRDQVSGGPSGGAGGDRPVLRQVAGSAGSLVRTAQDGADGSVVRAATENLVWLMFLYGYNKAYLEVALASPPPGSTVPPGAVDFHGLLDTRVPSFPLAVTDRFADVPGRLAHPRDPAWFLLAWLTDAFLSIGETGGGAVWRTILSGSQFSPETYGAVIDLSAGFLVVAEAALRASLAAAGDADPVAARCALKLAATLLVWSGSYAAGLVSDLPEGTVPQLTCD